MVQVAQSPQAKTQSAIEDILPLSPLQEGLLFHAQYDREARSLYLTQSVVELRGPLDRDRLRAAAEELLRRHATLRASFRTRKTGEPIQVVRRDVPVQWAEVDYSDLPADEAVARSDEFVTADWDRGFDIGDASLIRFTLVDLGRQSWRLIRTAHHILVDGWSTALMYRELFQLYGGGPVGPVRPFKDYLRWLAGRDAEAARNAWGSVLSGVTGPTWVAPPTEGVPVGRPELVSAEVPGELVAALRDRARDCDVTLNTLFQTAWAVVVGQLTGRRDVVFGSTVSGRPADLPGVDEMIGLFINTVPVRVDLHGASTVRAVAGAVQEQRLSLLDHDHLGLADIQRAADAEQALFDTTVVFDNFPATDNRLAIPGGPEIDGITFRDMAHYPLSLVVEPGERFEVRLLFRPEILDRAAVRSVADRLVRVLTAFASTVDEPLARLDLLSEAERRVVESLNETTPNFPMLGVHEVFAAQAARTPDATALVYEDARMTYGELNAAANRLADHLALTRGDLVAVRLERDLDLVIAVLAVLKAGGGYTLIDPRFPAARVERIIAESRPALVLDAAYLAEHAEAIALASLENPVAVAGPDDLACVMFTSGSTGRPKGVAAPHRAIVATMMGQSFAEFGPGEVVLQCAPVSWDAFALELFGALLFGGTAVLQPGQSPEPAVIARLIAEHSITTVHVSASLLNFLLDEYPGVFDGVRQVMTGGEAASVSHIAQALKRYPGLRLVNGYSPVENMIFTLCHTMVVADTEQPSIPLGKPLSGKHLHLLDPELRPVPPGVVGELYLSGEGIAHGYLGQPRLTAERFVANPHGVPGERMYRSGDLGLLRPDGTLEFLGRGDHQVKIRGFRVEPAEIETAIAAHPGVVRVAVVVREDRPGDKRLAAYVIGSVTPADLRRHTAERLPEHLVPAAFVPMAEFPMTASGKLDRSALPAPDAAGASDARGPRTASEEILCGLFADILGLPRVGVDDDFFALGGHSLLAARLISRIRTALGAELGLRDLFAAPTAAGIAGRLDTAAAARPVLRPVPRTERLPLSFAQQRLWFADALDGPGATYSVPMAIRLRGGVDIPALTAALGDVVDRHEALRTIHPAADGEPYQLILPDARPELDVITVSAADLDDAVREAARLVQDVTRDLPLHATLFTADGTEESVLLLVMHHIATDGWSTGILLRDLGTAYTARIDGAAPAWSPLPIQYADYAVWQRELLADNSIADQLDHWAGALAGLPEELALPTDRPRPATASHRGDSVPVALPAELHAGIVQLARAHQVTVFMVVQAAFAALLSRLGAGTDVPLGTVVAGRSDEALDDLVGFFVNSLVLRTDVSGDPTFAELLARVRETDLSAFAHQELPFDRLVEHVNPARSLARHPLFQVILVLQNNADATLALPGIEAAVEHIGIGAAKFDLTVNLHETHDAAGAPAGIGGAVVFATDLFDADTARALAGRLGEVLASVVADPATRVGALAILDAAERDRMIVEWNDTATDYPSDATIHALFERCADRTPTHVALVFDGVPMSYRELDERANRLANHLAAQGIGVGDLVAVQVPRGFDLVVGLVGVLKSGAGYVPVDVSHPADRIESILREAAVRLVVDAEVIAASAAAPATRPAVPVTADDVATVLFTSGSSGVPKGVASPHRATVRTFLGQSYVDFTADIVTLQCAPVSWDGLSLELWPALLHGGTCVLAPGATPDPAVIARLVPEHGVTTMWLSAGLFAVVLDEYPEVFGTLRQVMTGGEAPSVAHVLRARREFPHLRLVHGYGPVESMVFTNCHQVTDGTTLPVGAPIANTRVYVLDGELRPVPPGVVGELYAAGDGLALGYANRFALTAERFVADPFGSGARMYRTGDLARWTRDGVVEVCGRADDQVKIRGFRIELGEVEAAVVDHPGVGKAAVVVREDRPGDKRLVAYVVGAVEPAAVREHVAASLPSYMVPSAVVVLDALPLTPNGKLDRRALPAPDLAAGGRGPRTPVEEVLCGLFAELLGVERVGIDDDFFDLGGHSLLATRLVSRVRTALGVELSVRDLFTTPTVAGLARALDTAAAARPALTPSPRVDPVPLSFAQSRLWFIDQFEGPSATYNVAWALRMTGELDPTALTEALHDVMARHEALRTVFPTTGDEPCQRILAPEQARITVALRDVPAAELTDALRSGASHTFDLAAEPPVHAELLRTGDTEHALLVVVHHIAADGWSMGPLMRDLSAAYTARLAGQAPDWAALPVQYADYALWQRELLNNGEELAFWSHALDGLPEELALPTDRARPATPTFAGESLALTWDAGLHADLLTLARRHGSTLFMVLHAAVAALLTRHGAGTDVPIGTVVAGRSDEALDDLVGFFVNSLVLRTDVSGDPTFVELLDRVRRTDLAAFAHQDLPFERLVEQLNPVRDPARHPLFQVMLVLANSGSAAPVLSGLAVTAAPVRTGSAKFDLTLSFAERHDAEGAPAGLGVDIEYAVDLFDRATAEGLLARLGELVRALVATPDLPVSALPVLTVDERARLAGWQGTSAPLPEGSLVQLFEDRVGARPDATALVFNDIRISYGELNAQANRVARRMVADGVTPGALVAVWLERGPELVVSLLAALKAGAGYTLVDPELPADRIQAVLSDVDPALVVTAGYVAEADASVDNLDLVVSPESVACMMFTSGSTGRPKGVVTSHRALVGTYLAQSYVDFGPDEVFLQCSPVSWDGFGLELFGALLHGATCVLQPGQRPEPAVIAGLVAEHGVTMLQLSATLFNFLLDEHPDTYRTVRWAVTGGESASPAHVTRALEQFPGLRVGNGYGPAESMGFTTYQAVETVEGSTVPIGRPIANKRTYVLDAALNPVPPGVTGEIYVAGIGLAYGYLGQAAASAQRFVADPFGGPGERMYRTGDLGYWRRDGQLEFVGRSDDQVKIRGFRVEPGEIEAVIARHPAVSQVAVIARDGQLVAYVVTTDAADLRAHTAHLLPQHMVPSAFVTLTELPRTANGKLDRRALPDPELITGAGRAPRSPREEVLCGLFADVLGLASVGVEDDFFALGGHSLLAAKLTTRIRAALGADLTVAALFREPTVAGLARRLDELAGPATTRPTLRRVEPDGPVPLSFAQQRLWFLDRVQHDASYLVPLVFRLEGPVDVPALRAALADLVARHEPLRTVYPAVDGVPHQQVLADAVPVLAEEPPGDIAAQRFGLATELPVRAFLHRTGPCEHEFVLLLHHIATDGGSLRPMLTDLATAYRARLAGVEPEWTPLPVRYTDYAVWQRDLLAGSDGLDHWTTALAGLPEELALPTDRPRPAVASHDGGLVDLAIDADLHANLRAVARAHHVTVFMVVQAAFAALLSRLGAGTDIPVGTVVAGRTDEALDDLVGFFVNSLVLRTDVAGDPTFAELLNRVRETDLAAFAHQEVPFDQLVEAINPARSLARHPLFQVLLVQQDGAAATFDLPGVTATPVAAGNESAKFDLAVAFTEHQDSITGKIEYATDLFDESAVRAIAARLVRLLRSAVANPTTRIGALDVLTDAERRQVLVEWNDTATDYPADTCVHHVFEGHAHRTPDATALVFEGASLKYREVDERANQLAHHLIAQGTTPGQIVGVYVHRGPDLVIAILAALKAGAAYLPLDPSHPADRIETVLAEAGARIVATTSDLAAFLPETVEPVRLDLGLTGPRTAPAVPVTAEDPVSVLFTSGSTGRPKGVLSPHRSVLRTFLGQSYMDLGPQVITLQCAPVSWDGLALELWPALLHGGTCVLAPGQTPDPAVIARLVAEHGITTLWLSAGLFAVMADEYPHVFTAIDQVLTGGEAPSLGQVLAVRAANQNLRMVHGYGPVESMVFTNTHQITGSDADHPVLPVGGPLANTQVYVLDGRLAPVPPGVVGELYVAGDGLAHGYVNRTELTAQRFVACPFADGGRMYRTGDLVRWTTAGEVEFVGRADDQVKIRGFRVELGEIEAVLRAHPAVGRAAVLVREDRPGEKRLVGYAIAEATPDELRRHIAAVLPDYMVPAAVLVLDEFPLTPNGKLDRRALPAPDRGSGVPHRGPRTGTESVLCELFADLLGVDVVGIDDGFFDLGGHSLLATRLISRIRGRLGVELSVRDLFAAPTVAGLAGVVAETGAAQRPALIPAERPALVPPSYAQQRLLFLDSVEDSPAYNVPIALRLRGTVDPAALAAALTDVVGRHEALRTVFPEHDGVRHQHVLPPQPIAVDTGEVTEAELPARLTALARAGFDLAGELPLRATLLTLGTDEHVFALVLHHIAGDGWSMGPLLRDLSDAYSARLAGQAPDWSPLPVQYADYALWQRDLLGTTDQPTELCATQLDYWRTALDDSPEQLPLPTDRPRPAVASHGGDTVPLALDADLHTRLLALARAHGVTLFMVLQAGFAAVLARSGAGTDIPIGTPVAGRSDDALDDLVGFFVNTLVLRTDVSGAPTFTDLLERVRETDLAAFAHQDVPFEQLVEAINPARSLARHPLFQVMLVLQNNARADLRFAGFDAAVEPMGTDAAKFDLTLGLCEEVDEQGAPAGITGALEFATDLFDPNTAAALVDRLGRLLTAVAESPETPVGAVDLLDPELRQRMLVEWNDTTVHIGPEVCTHEVFQAQVARTPEALALVFESERITYAELNAAANRLAHHLLAEGVDPGELVGVHLDRGVELVVAVLAVLKAGGGYAMLDTAFPADRIAALVAETGARIVIDKAYLAAADLSGRPVTDPAPTAVPGDIACVMFTSGSTGRPKGVLAPHRALVGTFLGQSFADFGPGEVVLQCAPVSWDAFALELFGALLFGGTAVLQPGQSPEPAVIARLIAEHSITTVHVSASLLNFLLDEYPGVFVGVRQVMTGGEAASVSHIAQALKRYPGIRLVNGYSPVENMIFTLCHTMVVADTERTAIPVGRPIANKRVYVLDDTLRPVPPGVAGELYMAGVGMADGYLHQSGLTATRFVANPYGEPGERMYRTGDLVRWSADGVLDFLGRVDHQVKIRGFRVEPGDVETVIGRLPGVAQVAVLVREDRPGDKRLVAYVAGTPAPDPARLRAQVADQLPDYLVPSAFVPVDALPRTANGKLDRRALPAPDLTTSPAGRAPRTAAEEILCGLFAEVLGLPEVGVDDGFFDLGGHSLLAAKLISRVRAVLGAELGIRDIFAEPTVAGLVGRLGGRARPALRPAEHRPEELPLSFAQQRLWFLNRVDEGATYNVPVALRLRGAVDPAALRAAITDVADRHEALRTVFPTVDDRPVQRIATAAVDLTEIDLDGADPTAAVDAAIGESFDLTRDLPLRARLFRVTDHDHVLLLVLHHIAGDGWSMGPLTRDLSTAYTARLAGQAPDWATLPVQYADYALWQRELLGAEDDPDSLLAEQIGFWRKALDGLPDELDLLTDRPRPAAASYRGDLVPLRLDAEAHARLLSLARANGATLFMVLQAAFAAVLARSGAGPDVPIGTPVAGRSDDALDDLVGFFVNSLVLRTDVSGDPTFAELLARVREADLSAFAHQDVPFEQLVETINPVRSLARHPLFQVMLVLQNNARGELALGDLAVTEHPFGTRSAKFDLTAALGEHWDETGAPAGIAGALEFATDLFDAATAQALGDRLTRLLTAVAEHPDLRVGQIDLLSTAEREQLLHAPSVELPHRTAHELFEARAAAAPDSVAIVFEGARLTYGQLDARSNRLARCLVTDGVTPGALVAVRLERGLDLVVSVLAALKAGAGYTLIDPELPEDRIAAVLADTNPATVITEDYLGSAPIDAHSVAPLGLPVSPESVACVMFTSGSTGRPKGVVTSHRALVGTYLAQSYVDFGPDEVFLQCSPVSWDGFGLELFGALLHGATCVLQAGQRPEPAAIAKLVAEHDVTMLQLSATLFNFLLDEHPHTFEGLRWAVTGGEPASPTHVARALAQFPGLRVGNGYGPAESMGFTTYQAVETVEGSTVPIGRSITNKRTYVLDAALNPVPPGVIGEIYVAGIGLAHGYLGQTGATAQRFVADPHSGPGERMYRTGDLGFWRRTGELEFVGRSDDQVKIRGFRVEPGEVEAAIARHPEVTQVAVIARDHRLVAYVVMPLDADPSELRAHTAALLPHHMVPSAFVPMNELPRTANGKLDRRALPEPVVAVRPDGQPPRNQRERDLCEHFAEVLGLTTVGVHDNFFELGGHSLLAARLVGAINRRLGSALSVRSVFTAPTVAELAALTGDTDEKALAVVLPIRPAGRREPLFCIHPAAGISWVYSGLARHIEDRPLYGLQSPGLTEPASAGSVEALARRYAAEIRRVQPEGPYHLLGWSFGGLVAQAVAAVLQDVALLAVLDGYPADHPAEAEAPTGAQALAALLDSLGCPTRATDEDELLDVAARPDSPLAAFDRDTTRAIAGVFADNVALAARHKPTTYDGDLLLFVATVGKDADAPTPAAWTPHVIGAIEVHSIDCAHGAMTRADALAAIAPVLAARLS
ncbi:non-ribosomal peptide synthase/polyketide synthase [Kutzneria sp. NPDC052558]|uniref:non-ribosomal peptide synthase/polyketide synthase n=1 Tax=Kutzneria sp. NPDC052558 TaxID=3364121 RepID=UPI0037C9A319